MARMYGKFDRERQNSKGWTKASRRHDEERQIAKDTEAELDNEHVFNHPVAGYPFDSRLARNDG